MTDHDIAAISLGATASNGSIDGQAVLAEGTFSFTAGGSGTYIEVDLEAVLGTAPAENAADSSPITLDDTDLPPSGTDNDNFVFSAATDSMPEVGNLDIIADTSPHTISGVYGPGVHTLSNTAPGTLNFSNAANIGNPVAAAELEIHLAAVHTLTANSFHL